MKSRSASEWVKAYDHIHQELTAKGFKPKLQTLDNEASATLKNFFTTNNVEYQLVPPHCHRRNAAERAIRNFKEHFVVGLFSVDPTFPLHLWDRLLPQVEITLNILWTSRLHPQLSAAAHFHGLVDYNKTYFAPPGCKIIAHEKPAKRRTWAPHRQHGYSLGPSIHHCRCQNVYILATASECIVDTLGFVSHNFQMPQLSSTDRLIMAVKDMSNALKILILRYHSRTSGMTPSQRSPRWPKFSKTSFKKFKFPDFQLHLPRSLNAHSPPNHPIQS
jgi:hypothetical protein